MKEFIEKLIGRLEEQQNDIVGNASLHHLYSDGFSIGLECAMETINQLAEEHKDNVIINGQYCWQTCGATEHCKECNRLCNGSIDYYENYDVLAEEYNNGWISVDDALPEDDKDVWVKYADCERYGIAWYHKNFGWDSEDIQNCIERLVVEAWMPIVPYQPKGE